MISCSGVLCLLLLVLTASCYSLPEVNIRQGTLRGVYDRTVKNRQIAAFLSIPYAKPPIGDDRFKESCQGGPWSGVYNATQLPPSCLQYNHLTYKTMFPVYGSEDCLYLNVYTPKLPDKKASKLMDVIVFIHGGAFMMLSSTMYTPHTLLDHDVVFVSINYRLGPLGFLSTEDSVVPGNNGLKDQVLALKWIQENIAAFGGDPNSVTISGYSAGGASVHYHVLSPLSRGLFKRAISASGTGFCPWALTEGSRQKASKVATELGCSTEDTEQMVQCLRNRPAHHIVALSKTLQPWLFNPFSPYGPVVEPPGPSSFLPDSPVNIAAQGKAQDVPWMLSFASEEGLYPGAEIIADTENIEEIKNNWEKHLPYLLDYNYTVSNENEKSIIAKSVKNHYKINMETRDGRHNFIKMVGDRLFMHGIVKTAKLHSSMYTSPIYIYEFSYKGKYGGSSFFTNEDIGVMHADDSFYILRNEKFNTQEEERDRQLSEKMIRLWVDFAKNGSLLNPWTPVKRHLPKISYVNIQDSNNFQPVISNDLGEESYWDSLNIKDKIVLHKRYDEL